jgi:hypothetical protein
MLRWVLAVGTIGLAFSGEVASAQTYEVCIGESANQCPGAKDTWFQCGTSQADAARLACSYYDANGQQKFRAFSIKTRSIVDGGRCGYAGLTVTCME